MARESSDIVAARRELAKFQKNAQFFNSEYRKYQARGSELAQLYNIMAKHALARVRGLKRYIKQSADLQKRISDLESRIARLKELENRTRH